MLVSFDDSLRPLYHRLRANRFLRRFTAFTRVAVALGFIPSGLVKVIGHRFTALGIDTPVGFFFEAFYRSGIWYRVVGAAQVTAAVLLFFPRTAHLGTLLFLPIIFNIWLVTIGVGFGNTIVITSLMLLANIYLVCWEYDRVAALLSLRARSAEQADERSLLWTVTFALLGMLAWGWLYVMNISVVRSKFGLGGFVVAAVGGAAFGLVAAWHARGMD